MIKRSHTIAICAVFAMAQGAAARAADAPKTSPVCEAAEALFLDFAGKGGQNTPLLVQSVPPELSPGAIAQGSEKSGTWWRMSFRQAQGQQPDAPGDAFLAQVRDKPGAGAFSVCPELNDLAREHGFDPRPQTTNSALKDGPESGVRLMITAPVLDASEGEGLAIVFPTSTRGIHGGIMWAAHLRRSASGQWTVVDKAVLAMA